MQEGLTTSEGEAPGPASRTKKLPQERSFLRGTLAIADQAIVSLGNFLTNIILARTLLPAQYGEYAIVFSAMLFLTGLHNALVTYPLSVRGAPLEAGALQGLTAFSVCFTAALGLIFGTSLFVISSAFHRTSIGLWAAVALLCWILQETFRRALMTQLRFGDALWGDAVSYLGQAAVVALLAMAGQLSAHGIFGAMAGTSLLAAGIQAAQVKVTKWALPDTGKLLSSSWALGRWLLGNAFVSLFSVQFFPWTLAVFSGPGQAGAFQALANVVAITNPLTISAANLIIPASSKAFHSHGSKAAARTAIRYGTQGATLAMPYLLVTAIWPRQVLSLLYGAHSSYISLALALRVLSTAQCVFYAGAIIGTLLNALEQSRTNFKVLFASALFSVIFGIPLIFWFGLLGAIAVLTLGTVMRTLVLTVAVRRHLSRPLPVCV